MEQVARKSVVKQEQLPPTAESSENYFFLSFPPNSHMDKALIKFP